jgi:hypothetical protein
MARINVINVGNPTPTPTRNCPSLVVDFAGDLIVTDELMAFEIQKGK